MNVGIPKAKHENLSTNWEFHKTHNWKIGMPKSTPPALNEQFFIKWCHVQIM